VSVRERKRGRGERGKRKIKKTEPEFKNGLKLGAASSAQTTFTLTTLLILLDNFMLHKYF
jgi:hypothetical protein